MKLGVTLDILNQKDTPAFYADTLANRPAAGFTGRVFISTDTLDLYRDTGTTWVLLSPSSTGTITGSGAAGQVTYFSAASSITGSNNLFWDSVNSHLGIQTITPDCALDVNHNGTFVAKFNNTSSANTLIGIYNADNPQWLIGSNNVANNLTFYDATNFPTLVATTTMKTDGTTYIGGQTTGSGRLNVYSATGDNGIQISGPTAPSLRIDNAPTGATKRIGLGIATAVNNFIQGAVDRDMCIFNGSTTASPMLFGIYDTTNVQEAARISAARNFLVGTTTDGGQRLQISGGARATGYYLDGMTAGSGALYYSVATNRVTLANYNASGILSFETNGGNTALTLNSDLSATFNGEGVLISNVGTPNLQLRKSGVTDWGNIQYNGSRVTIGTFAGGQTLNISTTGFVGINKSSPTILLDLAGYGTSPVLLNLANPNPNCDITMQSSFSGYVTRLRQGSDDFQVYVNNSVGPNLKVASTGNLLVNTSTDSGQTLQVNGSTLISGNTTCTNILNLIGTAGSTLSITTNSQAGTSGSPLPTELIFKGFNNNPNGRILVNDVSNSAQVGNMSFYTYNSGAVSVMTLTQQGNVFLNSLGTGLVYSNAGTLTSTNPSDKNLKENINDIKYGLNEILKLRPVTYNWKEDKINQGIQFGFIAQEVQQIMPDAIKEGEYLGLEKDAIYSTLINAIKELNTKIENLK